MARTVKVMVTCDMCNTSIDEESVVDVTHRFGYDGKWYDLDLCNEHGGALVAMMHEWREVATPVSAITTSTPPAPKVKVTKSAGTGKRSSSDRKAELDRVREWARNNGFDVGDRGRIADNVVAAYRQATGDQVAESPYKVPAQQPFGFEPAVDVPATETMPPPVRSQGDNETEDYPPLPDAPSVPDMWDEDERVGAVRNPDGSPAGA